MNSNPNIVITGFMGTGKSTVGPRVAAALGRQFVDLDALIVARAGREIAQIFADDGVVAFRQLEAAAVDEVAAQRGLVVATGGGSLVSARNRRALASSGILVCLRATPEVLEARLSGASDRPLLHAEDRRARLRELLAGRAHAYDLIPHQVDTTSRSVDEVVAAIVGLAESALPEPTAEDEPVRLTVRVAGAEYPIVFDHADQLGALLRDRRLTGRLAIITNASVGPLHALPLQADLAVAGLEAEVLTVPDGEQYKTLATAEGLYTQLLERGFDRSSAVVALGGGVIGDLSGFVAATYMRGLPFVQVPTSLLAMADASVGGKVAVDHPRAKNLIGAFKQPAAVLIDTHFLTTLPRREWRNGLAEVVKHGLIGAPALFERLETAATDALAADGEFVREAVQVKIAVVEEDPFEHGRRTTLNLGHTFAHAFEVLSDFKIAHGEAVAIGLVAAARLSAELGHAAPALPDRVEALLRRLGLPTAFDHAAPEAVWQVMQGDKKKVGRRLRFVLVREVGEVFVTDQVPEAGVYSVLVGLKRR